MDKNDGISFDATMEQRLLSAHQDWLAQRQEFMIQWNQAQDVLVTANSVLILGLAVTCFVMARRVLELEGKINGNP